MARSERLLAALIALLLLVGVVSAVNLGTSSAGPVATVSLPTPTPTPRATTPAPRVTTTPPTATPSRPVAKPSPASLSATYTLSPRTGSTQTPFTLTVAMRDGDGQARVDQVIWGDGDRFRPNGGPAVTCPMPTPTPAGQPYQPAPSRATVSYGHAWRHPGTYRVTVQLISYPPPCRASRAETQHTQRQLVVRIGAGRQTTNGPATPVIGPIKVSHGASVPATYVSFPGYDTDGRISSVAVDWGDSSTSSTIMEGGCDDGSGSYYPGSQPDQGRSDFEQSNQYAKHGHYHVVVHVYSEGCLGEDRQHTSRSIEVTF